MSYCRQCGKPIDQRARYCLACGAAQETLEQPTQPPPSSNQATTARAASAPRSDLPGAIITIFGGVLLLASAFLPWSTATIGLAALNRNAYQLGAHLSFSAQGLVLTLLGLVAALIGITRCLRAGLPSFVQRSPIVVGIVALLLSLGEIGPINDLAHRVTATSSLASASIGFGLWLAILAALITVVGGLVQRLQAKAAAPVSAITAAGGALSNATVAPPLVATQPAPVDEKHAWAAACDPLARQTAELGR